MISSLWQLVTAVIFLLLVSGEEVNRNCEQAYCDNGKHARSITFRQPTSESLVYRDISGNHLNNDLRLQIPLSHDRFEERNFEMLISNRRVRELSRENREEVTTYERRLENRRYLEDEREDFTRNNVITQRKDFSPSDSRLEENERSFSARVRNDLQRIDRVTNNDDFANRQMQRKVRRNNDQRLHEFNNRQQEQRYRERETNENKLRVDRFENVNGNREILRQEDYNRFDERSRFMQSREQEERRNSEREMIRKLDHNEKSERILGQHYQFIVKSRNSNDQRRNDGDRYLSENERQIERMVVKRDRHDLSESKQSRQLRNGAEPARLQERDAPESRSVIRLEFSRDNAEIKDERTRHSRNDLRLEESTNKQRRDIKKEILRKEIENQERKEIRLAKENREKYFEFTRRYDNRFVFEESRNERKDRMLRTNAQCFTEDNLNHFDRLNQYSRVQRQDISRNEEHLTRERSVGMYGKNLQDHKLNNAEINLERRDTLIPRDNRRENYNVQRAALNRNSKEERTDITRQSDRIYRYSFDQADASYNRQGEEADQTKQFDQTSTYKDNNGHIISDERSIYYDSSRREIRENLYYLSNDIRRHELKQLNRLQPRIEQRIDRVQKGLFRKSRENAREEIRFRNEKTESKDFIEKPNIMLKKIYIAIAQGALICFIIMKTSLKGKEETNR
uniref:Uncharacterized protein n=1 Tax=Glossina brevipalpis TaxID=37001 RepID=A0A1A9W1H2_9MUSC